MTGSQSPRPRLEGRIAASSVAGEMSKQLTLPDWMAACQPSWTSATENDRVDPETAQDPWPHLSGTPLCLETCAGQTVAYVLNSDIWSGANTTGNVFAPHKPGSTNPARTRALQPAPCCVDQAGLVVLDHSGCYRGVGRPNAVHA